VYCRSSGVELDNIPHYGRWHNQMAWLHADRESQWGSLAIEGFHVSNPEGWILKKINIQRQNQYFDDDRKKSISSDKNQYPDLLQKSIFCVWILIFANINIH
jgi:hypothetical protein